MIRALRRQRAARAADTEIRAPVNVPGPVVTTTFLLPAESVSASRMTSSIIGIRRSACPVAIGAWKSNPTVGVRLEPDVPLPLSRHQNRHQMRANSFRHMLYDPRHLVEGKTW